MTYLDPIFTWLQQLEVRWPVQTDQLGHEFPNSSGCIMKLLGVIMVFYEIFPSWLGNNDIKINSACGDMKCTHNLVEGTISQLQPATRDQQTWDLINCHLPAVITHFQT